MFKENFKAANDSIHADERLTELILLQKSVKKRKSFAKYYSVAAAAVVVISVTAFTLPKMLDRNDSGVIEEHTATQRTNDNGLFGKANGTPSDKPHTPESKKSDSTSAPKTSPAPKTSSPPTSKPTTAPKAKSTPKASTVPKAKSTPKASAAPKATAAPAASTSEKSDKAQQTVTSTPTTAESSTPLPSYSFSNDSVSYQATPEADTAITFPTADVQTQKSEKTAVLNVNSLKGFKSAPVMSSRTDNGELSVNGTAENADLSAVGSASGGGGAQSSAASGGSDMASGGAAASKYAANAAEEYHSVEWSNEQYAEYLGYDLMKKLVLPKDFTYSGDEINVFTANKDGSLLYDGKMYSYTGDDARSITAVTTKDTANVSGYIDDADYELSDIGGIKTVIIQEEKGYECYMINNGISISVFTYGISEDELREVLLSLV